MSPDAGNPDNVGAVAPKPITSRGTTPRAPRPFTFVPLPDGGDAPDGAAADAAADAGSEAAIDSGQALENPQLDAVVASFNASVELECACLWSAPGYEYVSPSTCVAVGRLDQASAACVRAQLSDAPTEVLDCKLDSERVFRACLADGELGRVRRGLRSRFGRGGLRRLPFVGRVDAQRLPGRLDGRAFRIRCSAKCR